MTDLQTRLRDLADEAPRGLDARALWASGRRRHRVRLVAASGLALALLALVGVTGYGDWRSRQPDPAAPPATDSGPMLIPDRFFEPSPWLPTTSKPGRLVGLYRHVERARLFRPATKGVVGIAAGSQRYSFLDLPGAAPDPGVSLAPDGTHLAYDMVGPSTGSQEEPTGGVAVLDLRSGAVERFPIATEHGVHEVSYAWLSPTRLLVAALYAHDAPPGASYGSVVKETDLLVDVVSGTAEPGPRAPGDMPGDVVVHGSRSPTFVAPGGRRLVSLDPATGRVVRRLHLPVQVFSAAVRGSSTAIVDESRQPRVQVGTAKGGLVTFHRVPRDGPYYGPLLAWLDDKHVLAERPGLRGRSLVSLDVRTGKHRVLAASRGSLPVLAEDALREHRFVPAVAPARPWNRTAVAVWSLVVAVLVGFCALTALQMRPRRVRR